MKKRGIGYAATFYGTGYGNGFPDESRATVEINANGEIILSVEVSDVGSGGISVMWQIASETLNIDRNLIKLQYDNTSKMLDSGTAAASRQTYNTGNAVLDACKKIKINIDKYYNKVEIIKNKKVLTELYQKFISDNQELKYEGYFKATTSQVDLETGIGEPYWPYTFGINRAIVEVDCETGKVDVIDVVAVYDAGKIVNPVLAEGQIIGGVSMGMGYAIMEEVNVLKGSIKNCNYSDYIIPTSKDMPKVTTYFVEANEASGPYGAKGLGEPAMLPTAPAILNAIYDAIGVRLTEFPATCDRILLELKNKGV